MEMYVSCVIVQTQRIDEEKLKEKTRESKRPRKDNRNFSHSRFDGGNRSQGNSFNELMEHKFQSGGKSPRSEYLANSNACFGCGKTDHKVRDCP